MSDTLRLFIASPVRGQAFDALNRLYAQRNQLAARLPWRIKWIPPTQWHLTWLFLGNVQTEKIASVQTSLNSALTSIAPVEVTLRDVTIWPSARKARLIVCGLDADSRLLQISDAIRQALPEYPADKPFVPHITLARLKPDISGLKPRPADWSLPPFSHAIWPLGDVVLYSSQLTAAGPVYEALESISLG